MENELPQAVAESGWTQGALADALGVHQSTVARAIHKPSRRELMRQRIAALIQKPPPPTEARAGHE